jgi:hypothetical protein
MIRDPPKVLTARQFLDAIQQHRLTNLEGRASGLKGNTGIWSSGQFLLPFPPRDLFAIFGTFTPDDPPTLITDKDIGTFVLEAAGEDGGCPFVVHEAIRVQRELALEDQVGAHEAAVRELNRRFNAGLLLAKGSPPLVKKGDVADLEARLNIDATANELLRNTSLFNVPPGKSTLRRWIADWAKSLSKK